MTFPIAEILNFAWKLDDKEFVAKNQDKFLKTLLDIHKLACQELEVVDDPGPDDTLDCLMKTLKQQVTNSDIYLIMFDEIEKLNQLYEMLFDAATVHSNIIFFQAAQVIQVFENHVKHKDIERLKQSTQNLITHLKQMKASAQSIVLIENMLNELEQTDGIRLCKNYFDANIENIKALIDGEEAWELLRPYFYFFNHPGPQIPKKTSESSEYEALIDKPDVVLNNFRIRLEAFAQGAKLVCHHSGKRYSAFEISELVEQYYQFMRDKKSSLTLNPKHYQQMLYFFKKEVASILDISSKDIQKGEAYWAWETSDKRKNDFESSDISIRHIQTEYKFKVSEKFVPLPLTEAQKKELLLVFTENPPLWFKKRERWEQQALKKDLQDLLQIPDDFSGDNPDEYILDPRWDILANRSIPATLKWLPIVGTSQHVLEFGGKSYPAYRVSVPVPYDAHRKSQQHLTKLNVQQINEVMPFVHQKTDRKMLLVSLITGQQTEGWLSYFFLGFYELTLGKFKPVKDYNSRMVAMEEVALTDFSEHITHFNLGINWFRSSKPASIPKNYITTLKNQNPFKDALILHNELIQKSPMFDWENRNPNLFAAALMDAAERFSGGISIGHCKSSKDRKGIELLIADAMIVYFLIHNIVPQFNDIDLRRENFVSIVVQLFNTGIYSDIAAFHSPGSFGLKDSSIFPEDIKIALAENYKNSKMMASWNKPKMAWFYDVTMNLSDPKAQFLMCSVGVSLTLVGILLSATIAPLCIIGVGLILTQVLSGLYQYHAHHLEREFENYRALPIHSSYKK